MTDVPSTLSLQDRVVLVTGSSRGIGRALALGFAQQGADVVIHGASASEALRDAHMAVSSHGVRCVAISADLSAPDGAQKAFQQAISAFGRIDVLVLNASLQIPADFFAVKPAEVDAQIAVNFRSSFELMQLVAPGMRKRRWGRILTVGSVQQHRPHPQMTVYAATKCALMSLVENLARQFAPDGVTVNNLAPGVIDTDRNVDRLKDTAYRDAVLARIPVGRIGSPLDCVGAALLLCSDSGAYITGIDLRVDGGMSL